MSTRARRLLRIGALGLLVALAAGLAYALLSGSSRQRVDFGGRTVLVRQELEPQEPQFGDTVVATTEVFTAPGIDPDGVRLRTDFAPYEVASTSRTARQVGNASVVRVVTRLHCLVYACLPHARLKTFRFAPARISYGGGSVSKAWPALRVHSRLTKADAEHPVVRVPPPVAAPARFRGSPTAAGVVLLVLAALLAAAGAALLLRVGLRRGPERRTPPLEQVLRELAASCSNGDSGRRRRALDALARELAPLDASLSAESRVLAWGPVEPQAAAIAELTDRVRTVAHR